jgi:hypothetical protein
MVVPYDPKLSITGLQEAQAHNNRVIAALKPSGNLGKAVQYGTTAAHRYAVGLTHVDTGSLKSSHRMAINGRRGEVHIDPAAINPRSGKRTAMYGFYEHERGGEHAFYQRVVDEYGQQIGAEMQHIVKRGLS